MKAYTKEEIAIAKRTAFRYLFSIENIVLKRKFKYDKRTRIGNLAATLVHQNKLNEDQRQTILHKKRKRTAEKSIITPVNFTQNKLYIDYKRNMPSSVSDTHLSFNGRNHWAKTPADFKVLQVIKKYFYHKK